MTTTKSKILSHLRTHGSIDNVGCVTGAYGFISLRLGAVIFSLVKEGKIELDKEKCGFLPNSKNYQYVIKPPKVQQYFVGNELVATKYI